MLGGGLRSSPSEFGTVQEELHKDYAVLLASPRKYKLLTLSTLPL